MTTMPLPKLRPLGLGEMLDHAIRLYRRHFLTFVGIIAIVQIPLTVLQLIWSALAVTTFAEELTQPGTIPTVPDPLSAMGGATGLFGVFIVGLLSFILIQGVGTAALTRAIADSYLGQPISMMESYRRISRSWWPLLGALFLAGLVAIGLAIWFMIPCVGWLTGLGMLMFFSLVIVPLIAPTIVLEKQPPTQAVRRAWDLARRRFWWVLAFTLILAIFQYVIVAGPTALVTFLTQSAFGGPLETFNRSTTEVILQTSIQSAVTLLFSLLYIPLQLTAITLMYFDLRVRTEGFDLALLAESASETPEAAAEVIAEAPQAGQGSLITMDEMGYFVLTTVGGGVLIAIIYAVLIGVVLATLSASGGLR